jgi:hypothetical protein
MGRSASLMADQEQLELARTPSKIYNKQLDRYFEVFVKGSDVYQSEYQLARDGTEIFRNTQKLDYAIGAMENGDTYVVRRGNRLFEAPVSYYKGLHAWDLSPGYQNADVGFTRVLAQDCSACHTSRPNPVAGPDGTYGEPPFRELAIGCENCHGPGQIHVAERGAQKARSGSLDTSIVNPAKLSLRVSDNICMSCHEAGSVRVVHPEHRLTDFRPGTDLDETVSIFASARAVGNQSTTEVLSHFQGMRSSLCYRASGRMACMTCHDPHVEPAEPAAYFRAKCLTCHTESSCTAPQTVRSATTPADNCIGCHMPKKPTATIAHSALTDHRITKTRDEPLPEPLPSKFTEQTGLVHLDEVPGNEIVSPLILIRAYTNVLASNPSVLPNWLDLLGDLVRSGKADAFTEVQAGDYLLKRGGAQEQGEAVRLLTHAVQSGTELDGAYLDLAAALQHNGDLKQAAEVLRKGIAVDPSNPALYRNLVIVYSGMHDIPRAQETGDEYLREFPQDSGLRESLKLLLQR